MIKKPLVSIIIPTHNRSKYISRAIISCLNQTYNNIEVIIIDDFSSDDTKKIIDSFNDERIKYFLNNKNYWPCYSRNRWIWLSKWEFINFLDDDDELISNKIELQFEKFKDSKIKKIWIVTGHVDYKRADSNWIKKNKKKWNLYKDLLGSYCIWGTQQMLIKREVFEKVLFDEGLESNQEYDLMIQMSKYYNFDFLDKLVAIQHESENQISYNFTKKINWTIYLYEKYKNEFKSFWIKFMIYKKISLDVNIFKYKIWLYFWKKYFLLINKFLSFLVKIIIK